MSLRSVYKVPQNRAEFATGMLFRLLLPLPIAALFWVMSGDSPWSADPEFARFAPLIIGFGVGGTLGYAFAHGQRRSQQGLSAIGAWALGIGFVLLICWGILGAVFGGRLDGFSEIVVVVLVPALFGALVFFGIALQSEARKL